MRETERVSGRASERDRGRVKLHKYSNMECGNTAGCINVHLNMDEIKIKLE